MVGRDPIGIKATNDRDEILAMDADVVMHNALLTPTGWPNMDADVQAHVGELMLIVKEELVPAAVADSEVGESVATQPPAWLTVNVLPAMVSVPERAKPELAM